MTTETMEAVHQATVYTDDMRALREAMSALAGKRRDLWRELNQQHGVSQDLLAEAAGVTKHTVYLEIRKAREAAGA